MAGDSATDKQAETWAAYQAEKAAIAENLAAKLAAIADASAAEKATYDSKLSNQKAIESSILASQKASSAASLASIKAEGAARSAAQKASSAESIASIKSEGAIRAATIKASSAAAINADKISHAQAMAQIKAEGEARKAEAKEAAKAASDASNGSGLSGMAEDMLVGTAALDALKAAAGAAADKIKDTYHQYINLMGEYGGAGVKMALDQTAKKEVQGAIGKQLGGNYEHTVKAALKIGVDPEETWETTKKLLSDKFSQKEIDADIKIKTGMDLAGQNGGGFITELQKLKLEPKVKSADIDRLYKMGIDSKLVYADLAKTLGTTVPIAMAKVKAGAVDTGTVIAAVEKAANKQYGGLADVLGGSIPALIARAKDDLERMFDSVDTKPVKGKLNELLKDIEGPQGAKLKGAIGDLFGSILGLSGAAKTDDINQMFTAITAAIKMAAKEARALRGPLEDDIKLLEKMSKNGTINNIAKAAGMMAQEKITSMQDTARAQAAAADIATKGGKGGDVAGSFDNVQWLRRKLGTVDMDDSSDLMKGAKGAKSSDDWDIASNLSQNDNASAAPKMPTGLVGSALDNSDDVAGSTQAGQSLADGMTAGIMAGESGPINAASAMAGKALQAAKDKLQIRSPSEAFAEVGAYSAEGMTGGIKGHAGPALAAQEMGARALAGAQAGSMPAAGAPGAAGKIAAPGGGGVTLIMQIGAGASPAAVAAAKAALPDFEAMARRVARDMAEAA